MRFWLLLLVLFLAFPASAGTTVKRGASNVSGGTECVWLPADTLDCNTTNGCTEHVDTNGTNYHFWTGDFDSASTDLGTWAIPVPGNLSGTTWTAEFYWGSDDAACTTGADVCWGIRTAGMENGELYEAPASWTTWQGVQDACVLGSSGDLLITAAETVTHGWASSGFALVQVQRDNTGALSGCTADDMAAPAELMGLRICYGVDHPLSGE